MDVVLRLRELRRTRGLSQREAARLAGVGEKSISSFETGERLPSMKLAQLERLLHAYGVTMKEFFSETIDRKLAPWDVTEEDEAIEDLVAELRHLPRKSRRALLSKFRMMAQAATEMPHVPKAPPEAHSSMHHEWEMLTSRN
ncbi:MAG TPA: helix-turn-helix domain-containing protein [Thermoanaerobaculia bacterium]|nr:helix-turn-helix domain-containing protein [Thermoanaerobaculia bacterium]